MPALSRLVLTAATSLLISISTQAGTAYRYEIVDYPGATSTTITGVTDDGQLVGFFGSGTRPSYFKSFLRNSAGVFSELVVPDADITYANRITNDGRIVGTNYSHPGGGVTQTRAFLREANGEYKSFDFTPLLGQPNGHYGNEATVSAINSSGLAVGWWDTGVSQGAFLHRPSPAPNGTFTRIFDGADGAFAEDINDAGQIVGSFSEGGFITSLPASREDFTVIQYPGAQTTRVTGMNNNGDVVGSFSQGSGPRFFLRTAQGDFRELALPPGTHSSEFCCEGPTDINDSGQIVGIYSDPPTLSQDRGLHHGYIATLIVPEPELNLLFGIGLAVLTVFVRHSIKRHKAGECFGADSERA